MSPLSQSQKLLEGGPTGVADHTPKALVAAYPGPAFCVDASGAVLACNPAIEPVISVLETNPTIKHTLLRVIRDRRPSLERLKLTGDYAGRVFDLAFLPVAEDSDVAVLAVGRDSTLDVHFTEAVVLSRQLFKDLVTCSADFAWEVGADRNFAFVSPQGALGYGARELADHPARLLAPDPEAPPTPWPFESAEPQNGVEVWLSRADGRPACVLVSSLPVLDDDGNWCGARGVCRDVTEARAREAELSRARARQELTRAIVDSIRNELTPDAMFAAAAKLTARAMQAAQVTIIRERAAGAAEVAAAFGDAALAPPADRLPAVAGGDGADVELMVDGGRRTLVAPCRYQHELKGRLCVVWQGDEPRDEAEDKSVLADLAGHIGIAIAQAEVQDRLEYLSRTDELTGLLNRRAFVDSVSRRIAQHRRMGRVGALLYLDLDNFKAVNDRHGHARGDAALSELAALMANDGTRRGDIAGRIGGDEFAVWLEETGAEGAMTKANALLAAAAGLRRHSGSDDRPLTVSIGVAVAAPDRDCSVDSLIAAADAAMYRAKGAGKGAVVLAEDDVNTEGDGETGC